MAPARPGPGTAGRHVRGQALVEALIGASALGLFAALMVVVGKYQLLALAVDGASHSLAFECAMLPADCSGTAVPQAAARRLRQQHFTGVSTGLRQSAPWTLRDGRPFIADPDTDTEFEFGHPHFGAGLGVLAAGARSAAGSALHVVSNLAGPGKFDLEISGGLVTAHTRVDLFANRSSQANRQTGRQSNGSAMPDLRSGLAVRLSGRSAILSDVWNASKPFGPEPTTVETRVNKGQQLPEWIETAHRAAYAPTLGFLRLMGSISLEDKAELFRYHETDVDTVPADRIGP